MAMKSAGTPCPWDGKIGAEAQAMWDKYPELRPDYDEFLVKAEVIARIDAEIAKEEARLEAIRLQKEQEALAKKLAEEKAKLETLKAQEELNSIIETDLETQQSRIINVHK
jgi:hypothetical protein